MNFNSLGSLTSPLFNTHSSLPTGFATAKKRALPSNLDEILHSSSATPEEIAQNNPNRQLPIPSAPQHTYSPSLPEQPKPQIASPAETALLKIQMAFKYATAITPLNHGMNAIELFNTCLYIEQVFKTQIQNNQPLYHKRKLPELPRSVEYDPTTQNIYIHLKTRNVKQIGKGNFKAATYSILYSATPPQLIVQLTGKPTLAKGKRFEHYENETKFLAILKGLAGIVETYSMTKVPCENSQKVRYTYVQKFYNKGALGDLEDDALSTKQKEAIALCALEGLKNLHERKIMHGDLGPDQILVEFLPAQGSSEQKAKAVLADMGEASYTTRANLREELHRMGEIFTRLFFEEQIPYDEQQKKVARLLKKIEAKEAKGTSLLRNERIEQVILQMMTTTKSPTDTATKAYTKLKAIIGTPAE